MIHSGAFGSEPAFNMSEACDPLTFIIGLWSFFPGVVVLKS